VCTITVVDYNPIFAIAAIVGMVTGVISIIYSIFSARSASRQAAAQEELTKRHTASLKEMGDHLGDLVTSFHDDVESLRTEVGILRSEVENRADQGALEAEEERQAQAQESQDRAWEALTTASMNLTDVAIGSSWLPREREMILQKAYELSKESGPREIMFFEMGFEMDQNKWEIHITALQSQGLLEITASFVGGDHSAIRITGDGILYAEGRW